jgi:hypothetical protein
MGQPHWHAFPPNFWRGAQGRCHPLNAQNKMNWMDSAAVIEFDFFSMMRKWRVIQPTLYEMEGIDFKMNKELNLKCFQVKE